MTKELVTKDEFTALISEVKHKGVKAGEESISRINSLVAYQGTRDAVTFFSGYVDSEGNASTSPKGMMIQINKHIKERFGKAVDELSGFEFTVLTTIRATLSRILNSGPMRRESRKQVKARCYRAIDSIYESMMNN